jgi:hypothetical protein
MANSAHTIERPEGQNTGVASEPGHRGHARSRTRHPGEHYANPETWQAATPIQQEHRCRSGMPGLIGSQPAELNRAPRRDTAGLYVRQLD